MFTPISNNELHNLPIYVLGSNSLAHQKAEKYPGGFATCSQFSIFTGGAGYFVDHNKSKRKIRAGDVIYFTNGTPVEYYPITENWESKYIVCGGASLGGIMERLGFLQSGVIPTKKIGAFDEVNDMFDAIVELNKLGGQLVNSELSYLAYELLMTLGECNGAMPGEDPARKKLEPIITVIHERFAEDISLDELAASAGYNPTYVGKLFRAAYHTSPITYLVRVRVDNACKLLCSDLSLTVKEVGEMSGFNDKSYFGKVFKRYTGLTPKEYREANTYIDNRGNGEDASVDQ